MTNTPARRPHATSGPNDPARLSSLLAKAAAMMKVGSYNEAIDTLMAEPRLVATQPVASNTLAYLLLQAERPQEAIAWFEAALASKPDDAQALMGCGRAQESLGAHQQALVYFQAAVELRPGNAESWFRHGCVLAELGRAQEAIASLKRAVTLDASHAAAAARLRDILEKQGDLSAAIEAAIACCRASPKQALPLRRLADLLQNFGSMEQAVSTYDMALRFAPADFHCFHNKALALKQLKRTEEALAAAQQALRLRPDDSDTLMMCGGYELALGNRAAADACFSAVAARGVARRYSARTQPPRFRASLLFSPVSGNTPYEDLIKDSGFQSDLLIMLPGFRYDPRVVDGEVDVVVNLVSEADLGTDVIADVVELADRLEKPIVNHPRLILATDRQTIATRLAAIPDAVMPPTLRIGAADLRRRMQDDAVRYPVIIRHAGTHGGDRMELATEAADLTSFAEEAGDHPLYMTDYVDYSSPDGLFRKYRFIFVGEEILPYHLAIGDQWKVHHASTRMGEVDWMRDEEAAFLDRPETVFGPKAMAALDAIRREIGLDYFGIDCSLDAEGRVVVFEVNASMLIHLHNEGFEYKTPHVHRIRDAFERMLQRRAGAIADLAA